MFTIVDEPQPDWSILEVVDRACPATWEQVFQRLRPRLVQIAQILERRQAEKPTRVVVPTADLIFNAFDCTPLGMVKVLIIGQDPYHTVRAGVPMAQGLAFSTAPGMPLQPSVRQIFKEVAREYPEFTQPSSGDLSSWARQGVLLLNTALTTDQGQPNAHTRFWTGFIKGIIEAVYTANPRCVVMVWGRKAADFYERYGSNSTPVLEAGHPSPLNRKDDFLGCGHFRQANTLLVGQGRTPIDWLSVCH